MATDSRLSAVKDTNGCGEFKWSFSVVAIT